VALVTENARGATSLPRDDVVADFVREFFRQFEGEPAAQVSEGDDHFIVRFRIHDIQQRTPQLFVISETIAALGSRRRVAVVIIRFGGFERWVLLPDAIDADRVRSELIDGVLSVTLPKSMTEG
jgi:HSP20 family molecular chaperone IbpA